LPGGANITTAAGDEAEFIEYASGDYRCTNYSKASGAAVVPGSYTLPEANATTKGGIELFSNTDQSVAANSVSATAGKTYGLQLNSSGQGVVNVPWTDTDTDTTYSAGDFKLDDLGTPDDNTDLDFSTTRHGLVPKGTDTGAFLKDDGSWGTPTDTNTTYSAGSLLDLSTTTFNVDLSELTDGTADVVGSADELVYLDGGSQKRKQIDEIKLGQFNNDQSWADDQTSGEILTLIEDGVDSVHYKDGSIDNVHLADDAVDTDEIADNAVTLAKMAGGTDGNIISFDASGDPVAIATGSDGQVLTSAGAGAPPAFEDAAGGGKILQHRIYTLGTSDISTNSSTYEIVGSSMSFTPTSSSSQLFFNLQHYAVIDRSNTNNSYLRIALTKDSTDPTSEAAVVAGWICGPSYASGVDQAFDINAKTGYMDNDSTSEITFRIYHMSNDNSRRLWFHGASIDYGNASFLTISEIDSSITDSS